METLQEIETAIERLPSQERARLERWFYAHALPRDEVEEPAAGYRADSATSLLSFDEYLKREARSAVLHEYLAGEIFAMSGSSRNHHRISGNLFLAISHHLKGGPCEAFVSSFKVRIEQCDAVYYPDVLVACDRGQGADLYTTAPKLVIEVLSPSTRSKDEREKLQNYRALETLQEYVLVEQDRPELILYRRGRPWQKEWLSGIAATASFESIGLALPLAQIYAGVAGD